MKTDLDHLPPQKQRELERVVQLIFEEFDDAFALAKHDPVQGLADYIHMQSMPGPSRPCASSGTSARPAGVRPPKRRHNLGASRPALPAGPAPASRAQLPPKERDLGIRLVKILRHHPDIVMKDCRGRF